MRGTLKGILGLVEFTLLDGDEFAMDGNHGVTEAVEFLFGLTLGRLDHESSRNGPAHRRGVESEIHEALGNILHLDAGAGLPLTQVEDALVRDSAVGTLVEYGEIGLLALGHVVGVEDGKRAGHGESIRPHHPEIHPADDADAGAAPRSGADLASG